MLYWILKTYFFCIMSKNNLGASRASNADQFTDEEIKQFGNRFETALRIFNVSPYSARQFIHTLISCNEAIHAYQDSAENDPEILALIQAIINRTFLMVD